MKNIIYWLKRKYLQALCYVYIPTSNLHYFDDLCHFMSVKSDLNFKFLKKKKESQYFTISIRSRKILQFQMYNFWWNLYVLVWVYNLRWWINKLLWMNFKNFCFLLTPTWALEEFDWHYRSVFFFMFIGELWVVVNFFSIFNIRYAS